MSRFGLVKTTQMAATETKTEFARRLGVNKSTITRAAQAGRIVVDAEGRVEIEASLARWNATRAGRDDVAARHAAARGHAVVAATDPATLAEAASPTLQDGSGRAQARAEGLDYENRLLRLEMALRRGQRYPLADARREALGIGGMMRAAFERLVDTAAPRVAVAAGLDERRRILRDELRGLRAMIRAEFPRALRRLRAAGAGASARAQPGAAY